MIGFSFWQRWLLAVSALVVIFGLALAFLNQTPLFDLLFNDQIDPSFWGGEEPPANSAEFQRWVYGVLGAAVAGWGVFMTFIAHYPFRKRERWAWYCLATGLLAWYVPDTLLSLVYAPFNAAFNSLLLVALGLPLLFTRRDFRADR
jgi:hypothetical protein